MKWKSGLLILILQKSIFFQILPKLCKKNWRVKLNYYAGRMPRLFKDKVCFIYTDKQGIILLIGFIREGILCRKKPRQKHCILHLGGYTLRWTSAELLLKNILGYSTLDNRLSVPHIWVECLVHAYIKPASVEIQKVVSYNSGLKKTLSTAWCCPVLAKTSDRHLYNNILILSVVQNRIVLKTRTKSSSYRYNKWDAFIDGWTTSFIYNIQTTYFGVI